VAPGVSPRRPPAERKVARGVYYEMGSASSDEQPESEEALSDWEQSGEESEGATAVYSVHDSGSDYGGSDTEGVVVVRRKADDAEGEAAEAAEEDSSEDERAIQEEVARLIAQRRAERAERRQSSEVGTGTGAYRLLWACVGCCGRAQAAAR
jgi:hypothetical protein